MHIIVIGCGKVGRAVVSQLAQEDGNDISVVDVNEELIREVSLQYDVMGIVGNGASYSVLQDAGIDDADILIAVTESDEVNLLCCVIAKRKADCQAVARVRSPIYSNEREFLKKELNLSMITNPERAAARVASRLLRFPSAIEIDSFAGGRADMLKLRVPCDSMLCGCTLSELRQKATENVLVCAVERKDEVLIPDGSFTAQEGDEIYIIAEPADADAFSRRIGIHTGRVEDVMIIGGGKFAYYLTDMLLKSGIQVKIIERNRARCEELSDEFDKATIICGDGSDQELLAEEHLDQMDSLVACTGIDEENVILSLYGKKQVKSKVITKINHVDFDEVLDSLDLDSVINPKAITATIILQYVRATANTQDNADMERLYKLCGGKVEAMEFIIRNASEITGVKLMDMKLAKDVLIAGIIRDGRLIIPGGQDEFLVGDSVVVVTTRQGTHGIHELLEN